MGEQNGRVVTSIPAQISVGEVAIEHPEVEFALVLARTIDSVSSDPEQLRSAIYELARKKLQELAHDTPSEKARLMGALEVAIAGVEAHTKNVKIEKFPVPSTAGYLQAPASQDEIPSRPVQHVGADLGGSEYVSSPRAAFWHSEPKRSRFLSSMVLRYTTVLAFFGVVAAVFVLQRHGFSIAEIRKAAAPSWLTSKPGVKKAAVEVAQPAQAPPAADTKPKRPLPTAYGVYAESGGKLYELEMLQVRAPDPRIAISAAITKPSQAVVPDGHLRFIVFRREKDDAAGGIEVRLIARAKQPTSSHPTGKPATSSNDDVWVIRNISIPYRAVPMKEDSQMYEIEPRDPDGELSPGRYALVLKGQAFDFTVDGAETDKRHCLERVVATNGVFYTECPPQ